MNEDIARLQAENIETFMNDGPRLSTKYNTWILARDRERGLVLIGGLGAMGVGQMWFEERESHREYPGYDDAPDGHGVTTRESLEDASLALRNMLAEHGALELRKERDVESD